MCREGGLAEEAAVGRGAVGVRQRRAAVGPGAEGVEGAGLLAVGRAPGRARIAGSAAAVGEADGVAGGDGGHRVSHGLDDTGALMAEDHGQTFPGPDLPHGQVGVADAGGGDTDQDLVRPWRVEVKGVEGEGAAGGFHQGCLYPHVRLP